MPNKMNPHCRPGPPKGLGLGSGLLSWCLAESQGSDLDS